MSRKKQRIVLEGFTFSVNKLIIEHESESDNALNLEDGVRQALGGLISAPSNLLTIDTVASTPPLPVQPKSNDEPEIPRRKTRRRRRLESETSGEGEASPPQPQSRSAGKGTSARSLILEMHQEGFFVQDRPISDIRSELHTRGHSYQSNELSPVLLALTKNKTLARKKGEKGGWEYRDGKHGSK